MPGDFDETEFGSRRSVPAKAAKASKPARLSKPAKSAKSSRSQKLSKTSKMSKSPELLSSPIDNMFEAPLSTRKRKDSGSEASGRRKSKKGGKRRKASKPSRLGRSRVQEKSPPSGSLSQENSGVLVPLDQWTRVLNQLGNLHEAGQQLAEARERAAKAETEAVFLRERLKELRAELEVHKRIPKDRG